MKSFRMLALAMLSALPAMAFVGIDLAMAESTSLCNTDPGTKAFEVCPSGHLMTHVHESTASKMKVLTTFLTIECDVLYLGDINSINNLGFPLEINGTFSYTNCGSCKVSDVSVLGSTILISKFGHELAEVYGRSGLGEIHVQCGTSLDCEYSFSELVGHALGPLLVEFGGSENGEVRFEEQTLRKVVGGFLCPKTSKLDLLTHPLTATYITG